MKVIGAGLARTGTTSTLAALEELGFGHCYTFYTILSERPEHVARWLDIYAGKPVDWRDLFAGFNSVVDWPACDFYLQLLELWPEAKILLNVRDPEAWYQSVKNTIWENYQNMLRAGQGPESNGLSRLLDVMAWRGFFDGKFEDQQYAIDAFERHTQKVKQSLPPDKLLVFDVREGWQPLCEFLDVAVPDKPFPRLNDTEAFRERVRQFRAQSAGAAVAAVQ
jgi:hypothetical protein